MPSNFNPKVRTNLNLVKEIKKNKKYCPLKLPEDDLKIYEHFYAIERNKTSVDQAFILRCLVSHFAFSSLIGDKRVQSQLISRFSFGRVHEG